MCAATRSRYGAAGRPVGSSHGARHENSARGGRQLAPTSIPLGRIAEVEEVTNLVVMLVSPLMEMLNGTMIEIDGGQDKPLMDRLRDRPRG
jgi:NAD(P)-dependent dehydrogenase (short-subunit alcohol dehydrogenase family)